jgi:hypothetical protein
MSPEKQREIASKGGKAAHAKAIDAQVFPGIQGGPLMHVIAAKAVCFHEALQSSFREYQAQIIRNAKAMAARLAKNGYRIVSGGTDSHLLLVDLRLPGYPVNLRDPRERHAVPVRSGDPDPFQILLDAPLMRRRPDPHTDHLGHLGVPGHAGRLEFGGDVLAVGVEGGAVQQLVAASHDFAAHGQIFASCLRPKAVRIRPTVVVAAPTPNARR